MITVVVGKEIEKIKGDFESYLNGLNMVGEISYSQYSELYDEGTKQIQGAYELGRAELEKENADLKEEINKIAFARGNLEEENAELKHTIATLRQEKDNVSMHTKAMEVVAKTRSDQLTKAKEIIKKLVEAIHIWDCKNLEKVETEAEQFLNSEVEK